MCADPQRSGIATFIGEWRQKHNVSHLIGQTTSGLVLRCSVGYDLFSFGKICDWTRKLG